jgi:hypothetical protein
MNVIMYVGGGAAALVAIGTLLRGAWNLNRRIVVIAGAVRELAPNGGSTMKDAVTRTERKVDEHTTQLCELKRQVESHLLECPE